MSYADEKVVINAQINPNINMFVVFDTNVYRNLVSQKDEAESMQLIKQINEKEDSKGILSMMSTTVAMELIKHLNDNIESKSYKSCVKACKILYAHTGNNDEYRMLPLPETQTAKMIFGVNDTKAINNQKTVSQVLFQLYSDFNRAITLYSKQIEQIAKYVDDVERVYVDSAEQMCRQIDPCFNGWPPFQGDDKKRKKYLDFVKSDSFDMETSTAFLCALLYDLETQQISIPKFDMKSIINSYIENSKIPLRFRSWVFSQFVNGDFDLAKKSRANYLWDEYILHFAGKKVDGKSILLVTSDKKMLQIAREVDSNCLVKSFDEYLCYLDI